MGTMGIYSGQGLVNRSEVQAPGMYKKAFQSVSADMYSTDETRLFALFRDCKEIDDAARRYNGLEECGSELLSSMRRWMVDLTAVHH